jgi:hypothetical protein
MSQNFAPGDFLIFQLESAYALLRFLAVDEIEREKVWHVAAYSDFFPAVEMAEAAVLNHKHLTFSDPHIALTNRAFESTQVAKIANIELTEEEIRPLQEWRNSSATEISDRSVRLMLGLR